MLKTVPMAFCGRPWQCIPATKVKRSFVFTRLSLTGFSRGFSCRTVVVLLVQLKAQEPERWSQMLGKGSGTDEPVLS